ncbi:MAG: polysaccharide deacetylase family protein [Candidatus Manganitrophus sp. SB1]|nr:polysaccharide deacetylase family protein [Candidatus Manganitrophus morganii]
MNIKRQVLFGGYRLAKTVGFLRLRNQALNYANILCFHRVNNNEPHPDPLTVRVDVFDRLMQIVRREYNPISLQTLIERVKKGEPFEPNTVAITFDDGYKDNFLNAAPILKKYALPATFFVTSGYIDTERVFPWDEESPVKHPLMTWDEVRELAWMGFEIGGHTVNHVDLGTASIETAREEVVGCKEKIEKEIGQRINAFAFPFGRADAIRDDVLDIVRAAGFDCCCSDYGGKVTTGSDRYNLERVSMYPTITEMLMELDNFMTYYKGAMKINFLTSKTALPQVPAGMMPREP